MKTVITSNDRSVLDFAELKRYSGLFRQLSMRDVIARYKQTRMGFAWSIVRPLTNVLIFGIISYLMDRSAGFETRIVEVFSGVVFWQLLSTVVTDVSNSLATNAGILTKVYFPKIILPLSSILVCLVDFVIGFVLFLLADVYVNGWPSWQLLLFPFFLLLGITFSFGIGLLAATASVKFRDVKFILPFVMQIAMYASPVFIRTGFVLGLAIPESLKVLYQLNPFVFIMNGFRYCFFGTFDAFNPFYATVSVAIVFITFVTSIRYFNNSEKAFADFI